MATESTPISSVRKIPATPEAVTTPGATAATFGLPDAVAMDLSFLDLLTSLQTLPQQANSGPASQMPEKPKAAPAPETATNPNHSQPKTTSSPTPFPTATAHANRSDATDDAQAYLSLALAPQESTLFQTTVLNGLPYQGTVPIQQVFQLNTDGELVGLASMADTELSVAFVDQLKQAYKKQLPLRVVLNEDTTVILKFKNGQVGAEFLTQDVVANQYLKQALDQLRSRLSQKGLPVFDVAYRQEPHQEKPPSQQQPS